MSEEFGQEDERSHPGVQTSPSQGNSLGLWCGREKEVPDLLFRRVHCPQAEKLSSHLPAAAGEGMDPRAAPEAQPCWLRH